MTTNYRAGVVGCGAIGRAHGDLYAGHDRTELVAAADIDPGTLSDFADAYDVDATFGGHEDLFEAADLDLLSVCTWHGTHATVTIEAAESGVEGIVCEKPMCTSLGEAEDMLDAAERNDAKLTVEHNRRYRPDTVRARELVAEGDIGEPREAVARTDDGLLNWGTHLIDQARYVLGDPATEWVMGQVERRTDRHERREPIEDRCVARVAFGNGARLSFECDLPGPEIAPFANSLQVYGTDGQLVPDGEELSVLTDAGRRTEAPDAERAGLDAHLDDLLAWLEGERDGHRCAGRHARDNVEIMMAIYESLRTRGLVRAPLETRANPLERMIESGDLPVEYPGAYDIRVPYGSIR